VSVAPRSTRSTLVTGAGGFVGRRLVARLRRDLGPERRVVAMDHRPFESAPGVEERVGSIRDADWLNALVSEIRPDRIFHLAALADPRQCAEDPELARETNARGTAYVLEAARTRAGDGVRVLVVSTSAVYGAQDAGPIRETAPLRAEGAYARSKRAAERFARCYAERGLEVVVARPFNHSGAGQSPQYVIPALAARVDRSRRDGHAPRTGNLEVRRDFLHVEDVVSAYLLLIEKGRAGSVYNVCSGRSVAIADILAGLQRRLGARRESETDPALVRAGETFDVVGSADRLRALGWSPARSLDDLLDDVAACYR